MEKQVIGKFSLCLEKSFSFHRSTPEVRRRIALSSLVSSNAWLVQFSRQFRKMDTQDWNASTRQARIQGELDYRRSRSSLIPLASALSMEEEDELEGRAGDTGSVRSQSSGTFGDGDFPSGEFSRKSNSTIFPGSAEGPFPPKSPVSAKSPLSRSPPPPQILEQVCSLLVLSSALSLFSSPWTSFCFYFWMI